jgi:hypothetical protein
MVFCGGQPKSQASVTGSEQDAEFYSSLKVNRLIDGGEYLYVSKERSWACPFPMLRSPEVCLSRPQVIEGEGRSRQNSRRSVQGKVLCS